MADELTTNLVLLRFSGDVHIKARATRQQFVRRLLNNLQDALAAEGVPPRCRYPKMVTRDSRPVISSSCLDRRRVFPAGVPRKPR